jgi:hypothetical protein
LIGRAGRDANIRFLAQWPDGPGRNDPGRNDPGRNLKQRH